MPRRAALSGHQARHGSLLPVGGESPRCQRVVSSSPFGVEWAASVLPHGRWGSHPVSTRALQPSGPSASRRCCSSAGGGVLLTPETVKFTGTRTPCFVGTPGISEDRVSPGSLARVPGTAQLTLLASRRLSSSSSSPQSSPPGARHLPSQRLGVLASEGEDVGSRPSLHSGSPSPQLAAS